MVTNYDLIIHIGWWGWQDEKIFCSLFNPDCEIRILLFFELGALLFFS